MWGVTVSCDRGWLLSVLILSIEGSHIQSQKGDLKWFGVLSPTSQEQDLKMRDKDHMTMPEGNKNVPMGMEQMMKSMSMLVEGMNAKIGLLEERVEMLDSMVGSQKNEIKSLRSRIRCCLLYTSPSPRDQRGSRMPSSA